MYMTFWGVSGVAELRAAQAVLNLLDKSNSWVWCS